jgi:hypothetical protein
VRHWAEAAIGRRQLARALRRFALHGFEIRDLLVDSDSAQHSDRLLVGPQGVYVVGFRTLPGNVWRPGRVETASEALAPHARATQHLADVVSASLQPELTRLHIGVHRLFTVIGPEQAAGAAVEGLPLLGPTGLLNHVTSGRQVLSPMQVDALVDRVDDWLALRRVTGLQARAARQGATRRRHGSL